MIAGAAIVVVAAATFAAVALAQSSKTNTGNSSPTATTATAGKIIDGVGCNFNEIFTYHQHAHLVILDHGTSRAIPAFIGFNYTHDCLYWVHTHEPSGGVLHMEAPRAIVPKLKTFFDVWGRPITSRQIGNVSVGAGDTVKVWVNQKPYYGNPASILLKPHTNIWIEVGAPFKQPKPFSWAGL
ncbi:MAG: hypothetical protein DLM70_13690 [Chloroflexi bacterium]|nr:MAG: hypothetical protein DLM70_13690 [Chloroflexota bacterium]